MSWTAIIICIVYVVAIIAFLVWVFTRPETPEEKERREEQERKQEEWKRKAAAGELVTWTCGYCQNEELVDPDEKGIRTCPNCYS